MFVLMGAGVSFAVDMSTDQIMAYGDHHQLPEWIRTAVAQGRSIKTTAFLARVHIAWVLYEFAKDTDSFMYGDIC